MARQKIAPGEPFIDTNVCSHDSRLRVRFRSVAVHLLSVDAVVMAGPSGGAAATGEGARRLRQL
jgi:hypothetical protein